MAQIDLMEAAEAAAVESAILWQVQTILEALLPTDELDAWLHGVGLAGAIGELKSEVERMETVINGVKGRAVGNKPLARSLARVKELMYDADDVDTWWMSSTIAGSSNRSKEEGIVGDGAEQVDASANTVVMLAPAIEPEGMVGDGDNRDGAEHVAASASTAGVPNNNAGKNRCKEWDYFHITPAVNGEPARAKCIDCGTQVAFSYGTSVLRKHRNSASCKKKRATIEEAPNCPRYCLTLKFCIASLFQYRIMLIWVWVSNIFDEVRVIMEILDVITLNSHEGSPRTKESYEGPKKFLLVLDDVNDSMDDSRWKDLLDALGSSCTKGNVIIVTARNLSIAQRLAYAFGDNNNKEHLDIGYQIAAKLKGNPLAAESAAEMLREQPTLGHWKNIIRDGVWESLQHRGSIMTTLKINYYLLSYQLQQCFLFCSIFPNGYLFHIDDLVYMWISSGFVKSIEVGQDYLNALVNSGFLQHVETKDSILHHQKYYVMCGIMHEFARLVSRAEFATMDGLECKEVLSTVRHFSILIDSVYHEDECGIILRNGKFEEKLKSIISLVRGLRTLILIGDYDSLFFRSFQTFVCSLVNCAHLRYLKLENKWSNEALPISLSNFYHLKVLDARRPVIIDGMSDHVSIRKLVLTKGACCACSPSWSACLQTIRLEDCKGWEILPSLERLSFLTKLKLRNMLRVTKLLIPSLKELVLIDMPKLERCFPNSVRDLNSSLRVLEIRRCLVLKAFPLFESCEKFEIEKSWLPNVSELTIHGCLHLMVSNPLPPSSRFCKLFIERVSALPKIIRRRIEN
ncbi:unnamed protein product [Miscanthus lutarioriparius]|uniref:BED-type domain-containing protein n=1 Tax=Miscanthus lutarioriparius TaxID=422564 RepID=A0A811RND1_9POAL|nr:unnamed protein product [Miscanthus lutarioriparius]